MSLSVPFITPSEHVGTPTTQMFPVQTPLTQSDPLLHPPPLAQSEQVPPPQSTSVSAPLLVPSEHVAAAHTLDVHTKLGHCPPAVHSTHDPVPLGIRART
jgi:hypothetical protein